MINPLDLLRLALRIESLQHTSTYGWATGDAYDMHRLLPTHSRSDSRFALPHPDQLRASAKSEEGSMEVSLPDYQKWIRWCMDLEHCKSRNRPGSYHRIMRDMARGRIPS